MSDCVKFLAELSTSQRKELGKKETTEEKTALIREWLAELKEENVNLLAQAESVHPEFLTEWVADSRKPVTNAGDVLERIQTQEEREKPEGKEEIQPLLNKAEEEGEAALKLLKGTKALDPDSVAGLQFSHNKTNLIAKLSEAINTLSAGVEFGILNTKEKYDTYKKIKELIKEVNNLVREFRHKNLLKGIDKTLIKPEHAELREVLLVLANTRVTNGETLLQRDELISSILEEENKRAKGLEAIPRIKLEKQARAFALDFLKEATFSSEAIYLYDKLSKDYLFKITQSLPKDVDDPLQYLNQPIVIKATGKPVTQFEVESAEDALEQKNSKARSLFGVIPALISVLKDISQRARILPKGFKITKSIQEGLDVYTDYVALVEEKIEEIIPSIALNNADKNQTIYKQKGQFAAGIFQKAPLHYLRDPKTGKLPSNLGAAIAAEVLTWLATMGSNTVSNDPSDIARMLGLKDTYLVPQEALKELMDRGTFRSNFVGSIGPRIVKHLNIRAVEGDPKVDGYFQERLENSLALLAIEVMYKTGHIEKISSIPAKKFNVWKLGIKPNSLDITRAEENAGDATYTFIKVKTDKNEKGLPIAALPIQVFQDAYKGVRKIFEEVFDIFSEVKKQTTDKKEAEKVTDKVDKTTIEVDPTTTEGLAAAQQVPITFNEPMVELLEDLGLNDPNSNFITKEILGYIDPKTRHIKYEESQEGINRDIARGIHTLKEALADNPENAAMYFLYSVKRNFRTMLDSREINWQSDKALHRSLITIKDWEHTLPAAEIKAFFEEAKNADALDSLENASKGIQDFLSAIAFGLGIKDRGRVGVRQGRNSIDKAVEDGYLWNDIYQEMKSNEAFRGAIDALKKHKPGTAFTEAELDAIGKGTQKGGEKTWSLAALQAWTEFENASEAPGGAIDFVNRLPMEVDGLTNGLSIMMLHLPGDSNIGGRTWEALNRTGIFDQDQAAAGITGFAELKANNPDFLDNYQLGAVTTDEIIKELLSPVPSYLWVELSEKKNISITNLRNMAESLKALSHSTSLIPGIDNSLFGELVDSQGNITKFGRNLFKQSVMTSAVYAAGKKSVLKQIAVANPYDTAFIQMFYAKLEELMNLDLDSDVKAQAIHELITKLHDAVSSPLPDYFKARKHYQTTFKIPTLEEIKTKYKDNPDPVREFARNYPIPPNAEEVLIKRAEIIYGEAAWEALYKITGPQQELRNTLLLAMDYMAQASIMVFDKRLDETMKKKGNGKPVPLSKKEMQAFEDALRDEGWGMTVRQVNSIPGKYSTYLDFGKEAKREMSGYHAEHSQDMEGKELAQLDFADVGSNDANSSSISVRRWLPTAEIGVAGFVKLVQSMDGAAIIELMRKDPRFFHVFDAFISGTGNIREMVQNMQQAFFDINFKEDYSIHSAVTERFEEVFAKVQKEFSEKDREKLNNIVFEKAGEKYTEAPVEFPDEALDTYIKYDNSSVEQDRLVIRDHMGALNQFSKSNAPLLMPAKNQQTPKPITDIQGSTENTLYPPDTFNRKYSSVLQADTLDAILTEVRDNFENMVLDKDHQQQLDELKNLIAIPALSQIDQIAFEIIKSETGRSDHNFGSMAVSGLVPQSIYVEASGNINSATVNMPVQEIVLHETVHAILYSFLEGPENFTFKAELQSLFNKAKKVINWEDFVDDPRTATQYEREAAQARYEYIFENKKGAHLHEFAAIGLTNKQFAKALTKIVYTTKNESLEALKDMSIWRSNPLSQLVNIFMVALEWLRGKKYETSKGNVQESLKNLVRNTVAITEQEKGRLHSALNDGWANKVTQSNKLTRNFTKRLIAKAYRKVVERRLGKDTELGKGLSDLEYYEMMLNGGPFKVKTDIGIIEDPNAERVQTPIGFAQEATAQVVKDIETALGKKLETPSFIQNLVQEIGGLKPGDLMRWRTLKRLADVTVQNNRKHVADTVKEYITNGFGRKLSPKEWKAFNEVILRTDLSAVVGMYDLPNILRFITDPEFLTKQMGLIKNEIRTQFGLNSTQYINQALNLGLMISRGQNYSNVSLPQSNAYSIANLYMRDPSKRKLEGNLEAAERLIDSLASLQALKLTDEKHKATIIPLLQEEVARGEWNGLTNFLGAHKAFKAKSLAENFNGDKTNTYKGYNRETLNPNVQIQFKPLIPKYIHELETEGYTLVTPLEMDPDHAKALDYKTPIGMFVNKLGLNRWQGQIVSTTNPQSRGSSVEESFIDRVRGLNTRLSKLKVRQIAKALYAKADLQTGPNTNLGEPTGSVLVPTYDSKGDIKSLRYIMNDKFKVSVMGREDSAHENLGLMYASIDDKNASKIVNKKVIDSLFDEFIALRKVNRTEELEYIGLDIDLNNLNPSERRKAQKRIDAFRLLPDEMQFQARKAFKRPGLYIRKDLFNYIIGFREVSVSNMLFQGEKRVNEKLKTNIKLPLNFYASLRVAEDVWQEVVSFARYKTSVALPQVVFGNIFSNNLVLFADGIPPEYIVKTSLEGLQAIRQYQKDRIRLQELETELGAREVQGQPVKGLESQIEKLRRDLRANSANELVQEGMYQAIVEDVNPDSFKAGHTQYLQKKVQQGSEYLSEVLEQRKIGGEELIEKGLGVVRELTMMPGSKTHAAIMNANQYGDFLARYVKFKYDTEVRKKDRIQAINETLDDFVYYNEPTDPYIQFINNYGIFMFWKFYARIQRVGLKLLRKSPASTLAAVWLDNATANQFIDSHVLSLDRLGTGINLNPWETLTDAAGLPLFKWIPFVGD